MDRQISGTRRRQVIKELRHQLRYSSLEEREQIRQQLNFWEQHR